MRANFKIEARRKITQGPCGKRMVDGEYTLQFLKNFLVVIPVRYYNRKNPTLLFILC